MAQNKVFTFTFDANTSDETIQKKVSDFVAESKVTIELTNIKRDKNNLIKKFSFSYNDGLGNSGSQKFSDSKPIAGFTFRYQLNNQGKVFTTVTNKSLKDPMFEFNTQDLLGNLNDEASVVKKSYQKGIKLYIDEQGNVREEVFESDDDFDIENLLGQIDQSELDKLNPDQIIQLMKDKFSGNLFNFVFSDEYQKNEGLSELKQALEKMKEELHQLKQKLEEQKKDYFF